MPIRYWESFVYDIPNGPTVTAWALARERRPHAADAKSHFVMFFIVKLLFSFAPSVMPENNRDMSRGCASY